MTAETAVDSAPAIALTRTVRRLVAATVMSCVMGAPEGRSSVSRTLAADSVGLAILISSMNVGPVAPSARYHFGWAAAGVAQQTERGIKRPMRTDFSNDR